MDVQGWRKWLRTPAPTDKHQKQQAGMLKLLLGHWKAHRKKPSLLPEVGDVHFRDPSTINPLFEDSDSSTSSPKRHSRYLELNQSSSQIENEQKETEINESLQTQINEPIQTEFDSQVDPTKNNAVTDESRTNELEENLIPIQSKDANISNTILHTKEITDSEKGKDSIIKEGITEPKDKEEGESSEIPNQSSVPLADVSHKRNSSEISLKSETTVDNPESDENMRLYNQPSTSAITENKKRINEVSKELDKTHTTSKDGLQKDKEESKETNSPPEKVLDFDADKIKSTASPFKENVEKTMTAKSVQFDNETEKPANLKARAIDELIKKFQGSKIENKNEIVTTKSENKSSINPNTSVEKTNVKTVNTSSSSPSTHINETVHKIAKPERKVSPKTSEIIQSDDIPNKSNHKVEALSNIFKFPPPPPLEYLQNESSLHGKILKDRKINPLLSSNKLKANESERKEIDSGKTRSDSSLDRTRSASSSKFKDDVKLELNDKKETVSKTDKQSLKEPPQLKLTEPVSVVKDAPPNKNKEKPKPKSIEPLTQTKSVVDTKVSASKDETAKSNVIKSVADTKVPASKNETAKNKVIKSVTDTKVPVSKNETAKNNVIESVTDTKVPASKDEIAKNNVIKTKTESFQQSSQIDLRKKESPISSPKTEISPKSTSTNFTSGIKSVLKSPVQIRKSSNSQVSPQLESVIENDNVKLNSEDSGITRGDQISSETTQETPPNDVPEQTKSVPNSFKKNKKDKKLKSVNKKICKNCRHAHNDSIPIKKSLIDEYYDGLTGIRHIHKNGYSDSWTSDLSWEEREFLRRLRSRRGTVRSKTPSTRSRLSKRRFVDENHFRRHHNFRRSLSDESSFYGGSLCSCNECWAMHLKEYAYGRASLRGMSPIQETCTCRSPQHSFLGRRVQFRPDIIHEASLPERTVPTPAPSLEKKQSDDADDKSSQKSTKSKDSISTHPDGQKEKKTKNPEDVYRFVTPWEFEELDFLMRKHLLQKRRRRARYMGIMALAMVVFVGLIVAIVMVYLRRKTL